MATLAPILEAFFTDHLMTQRQASPHTIAAYRDTFRLLLAFTRDRLGKAPASLEFADWDTPLVSAFLQHLETERANTATTRNARLAAIHSLFAYAAVLLPEHAGLIQRVLAMPPKRHDRPGVCFLDATETRALLAAPDQATWTGRRDHALLQTAVQTGLRVSEITGLRCQDAHLGTGPHLRCHGKGRKQRCTPLTTISVKTLRAWLAERAGSGADPLFSTRPGHRLSRDAVEHLVAKHADTASKSCPTLHAKTVSPHVLRHSAAMALLHAGVDLSVIALWLGHESTQSVQAYLHADMALKERALARTTPHGTNPGRYRPPDALLAFLDNLVNQQVMANRPDGASCCGNGFPSSAGITTPAA
jgi:site-specific recombinase XerD